MPRRKAVAKREILPDPLFRSPLLAKFINTVMQDGKKNTAERIVYDALNEVVRVVGRTGGDSDGGDEGEGGKGGGKKLPSSATIYNSDEARSAALAAFREALKNVMPVVEVKSRRVGGSTYQVPMEIRESRRTALAMRWLVEYASERSQKGMTMRLAQEIMDAIGGKGGAVKKRGDVHRMADANKAFAHYRW